MQHRRRSESHCGNNASMVALCPLVRQLGQTRARAFGLACELGFNEPAMQYAHGTSHVKGIESQLSAWSWGLFTKNVGEFSGKVAVDLQKVPKTPVYLTDDADIAFPMIFAAPVTYTRPTKATFHLTSMFNGQIDFYLNGSLANGLQSDCFVPAWMVAVTDKQSDSNVSVSYVEYYGKINVAGRIEWETDESVAEDAVQKKVGSESRAESVKNGTMTQEQADEEVEAEKTLAEENRKWMFTASLPYMLVEPQKIDRAAARTELRRFITPAEQDSKRRRADEKQAAKAAATGS
eukprot:1341987-Pyramimonas_sp.AAC.1